MPGLSRSKNWPLTVIDPGAGDVAVGEHAASPTTSCVPFPSVIVQFSNRLSISTCAPASKASEAFRSDVAPPEIAPRRNLDRRRRRSPESSIGDLAVGDPPGAVAVRALVDPGRLQLPERPARSDEARHLGTGQLGAVEARARQRRLPSVDVAQIGAERSAP